jgi:hypothetical protein
MGDEQVWSVAAVIYKERLNVYAGCEKADRLLIDGACPLVLLLFERYAAFCTSECSSSTRFHSA